MVLNKTSNELEFVKPPKKIKCENCPRVMRKSKMTLNKRTGLLVCPFCQNKLGENIFYTPVNEKPRKRWFKRDIVGKYALSNSEKKLLGKSESKKVCWWLNTMKRKKIRQNGLKLKKQHTGKKDETNKMFLQGLGQK